MRIHTGGVISMGYAMILCQSIEQNLNVKVLTEAELIGTSEYVTFNLWMVMFMDPQGYKIKKNILLQYNQSTISMENNGRASCTGNSRHIHIRYFFVKDIFDKGKIELIIVLLVS